MAESLTKEEYINTIARTLVEVYGGTLTESDTHLRMAKAVYTKLRRHLMVRVVKKRYLSTGEREDPSAGIGCPCGCGRLEGDCSDAC